MRSDPRWAMHDPWDTVPGPRHEREHELLPLRKIETSAEVDDTYLLKHSYVGEWTVENILQPDELS